jgi:hypothetical protein
VILAGGVHLGRNVRRVIRRHDLRTTAGAAFGRVAEECRAGREPRWLTDPLLAALHAAGWAHSIEVRLDGDLAGGAIGIGIGRVISGTPCSGGGRARRRSWSRRWPRGWRRQAAAGPAAPRGGRPGRWFVTGLAADPGAPVRVREWNPLPYREGRRFHSLKSW